MSVRTIIKTKQNRLLSKTWRTTLEMKQVERNNYHVTGNIKRAKDFVYVATRYKEHPPVVRVKPFEPIVIYSRSMVHQVTA